MDQLIDSIPNDMIGAFGYRMLWTLPELRHYALMSEAPEPCDPEIEVCDTTDTVEEAASGLPPVLSLVFTVLSWSGIVGAPYYTVKLIDILGADTLMLAE